MTHPDDDSAMQLERDDATLITTRDGTLFVCYIENVGGRGDRWVYVSADRTRYDGGIWGGEDTLEQIRARFHEWWIRGVWRVP